MHCEINATFKFSMRRQHTQMSAIAAPEMCRAVHWKDSVQHPLDIDEMIKLGIQKGIYLNLKATNYRIIIYERVEQLWNFYMPVPPPDDRAL
jgi:hypothetical protein